MPLIGFAQSTEVLLGSREIEDIERWEALNKQFYPSTLPNKSWMHEDLSRNIKFPSRTFNAAAFTNQATSSFSNIDNFNREEFQNRNGIWFEDASGMPVTPASRRPILKYFYRTPYNFYDIYTDDIYLAVNPVLGIEGYYHKEIEDWGYINFRGAEVKGRLFNKIGFYTRLGDNQLLMDPFTTDLAARRGALPGYDYSVSAKPRHFDLFQAEGYFNVALYRQHIQLRAGHDYHFIGYGMRSLVLSHENGPQTFVNLRGEILPGLTYDFLYLQLIDDYTRGGDQILPKKYAQIHQVNYDISPRVRVGIFEKSIFPEGGKFNPLSIIPLPSLQTIRQNVGSPIQSEMGIQAKANVAKGVNIYGQAFIKDVEFKGYASQYRNQWAAQLGAQYFNAFTLNNLDLQAEINYVRPFAYSSTKPGYNYSHYNQTLAHSYGSGFIELMGRLKYQVHPRLTFDILGSFMVRPYNYIRSWEYVGDYPLPVLEDAYNVPESGVFDMLYGHAWRNNQYIYAKGTVTYEWRPNIKLVGGAYYRKHIDKYLLGVPDYRHNVSPFIGLNWNFINRNNIY